MDEMFDYNHDRKLSETEKIERDCFYITEMIDDSCNTASWSRRTKTERSYDKGVVLIGIICLILAGAVIEYFPVLTLIFVALAVLCFRNS